MVDETTTVTANGQAPHATKPNRLFSVLRNLKPLRIKAAPATAHAHAPDDQSYGMHGVTSDTDIWFEYRVAEVKKEALELASEWAQAAIPKTDVVYTEMPPELILAKRCSEVLRRWRERLLNKVQDAINQLTGRIGVTLVDYRDGIATLNRTRASIVELEQEAQTRSASLATSEGAAEIHSFLRGWGKYVLIAALVFADWVANVPVFYELLPKDAAADQSLQQLLESTEAYPIMGGLMRLGLRFLHSPEASILALTVVLFLMIFGHKLGESLREVVSLKEEDAPTISKQIRARRRQFIPSLLISALGVSLLVFVLYNSRGMLVDSTTSRLRDERTALTTAIAARDAGFQRATVSDDERATLEAAVEDQRVVVRQAEDGVRYATNLARANVAIMVLNMVLALSAALIGYLAHKGVVGGRQENPQLTSIRNRIAESHATVKQTRLNVQQAESRITDDLSELDRFISSRPLSAWEAKADRLKSVVQVFRSENARLRGIDSANILAFRNPIEIDWPEIGSDYSCTEPSDVAEYRQEFARLREELRTYDREQKELVTI
jgi:hypothetical protein